MITPILKDPKAHGGTLYTFPSASRDLTRSFTNSDYEFAFSHFACLNLPDFRYGHFADGDLKGIYLDDLYEGCIDTVDNFNRALKWHMQSYVMNYEVAILNGFSLDEGSYNSEELKTPSERIFFNWLQKVGAIKFDGFEETLLGYGDDADIEYYPLGDESELPEMADSTQAYKIGNKLYVWKGGEWRSRVLVSKTVQYIGTIDMINNVNIDYDSFNEIYLNIPASVGGSTKISFDNYFDANNYEKNKRIDVDYDEYCDNKKFIIGRDPEEMNSSDVTLTAIYDKVDDDESESANHSYKIESGYCINFNDSEYADAEGKIGIEAMNMGSKEDFEFNCVLVYYRIRKGSGNWQTNLYGVLFLEEVTTSDYNVNLNVDDERGGYIQRYPKFKNGNSWGLKLDLKIDAQPDSQLEIRERLYDDPNDAIGMQMFTEALVHLNDCVNVFYEVKKENTDIEERLYKLENMVSGIDNVYDLSNEVGSLRTRVEMVQPSIDSLEGRMTSVEDRITKLEENLGYLISIIKNK